MAFSSGSVICPTEQHIENVGFIVFLDFIDLSSYHRIALQCVHVWLGALKFQDAVNFPAKVNQISYFNDLS